MESTFQKTTAIILGLGSLMFLVAAFLPYSRVFAEPHTGKKLTIIMDMKKMWTIGQVLFWLGAVIIVIALDFYPMDSEILPVPGGPPLAYCWSLRGLAVVLAPPGEDLDPEAFVKGLNTPYLFLIYSILTQAGMALIGILLLRSCVINWVGWMFIIGSGVFFVLMVIFKDMPPFVYYVLSMIAAVVLVLGAD